LDAFPANHVQSLVPVRACTLMLLERDTVMGRHFSGSGLHHVYELFKLGTLFWCKNLLRIWIIGKVFGDSQDGDSRTETFELVCNLNMHMCAPWRTCTTTNWPLKIFSVSDQITVTAKHKTQHNNPPNLRGLKNRLCAISLGFACVRMHWKWRQQCGLKAVLAYVTSILVNMSITRYTLFRIVSWDEILLFVSTFFWRILAARLFFLQPADCSSLFVTSFVLLILC
jgi:hypothetical protein